MKIVVSKFQNRTWYAKVIGQNEGSSFSSSNHIGPFNGVNYWTLNSILNLNCICVVDLQIIDLYTAFALTTALIQVQFALLVSVTDAMDMLDQFAVLSFLNCMLWKSY